MISITLQFHDGMRACARLDSVEIEELFGVNQGLVQGCVLSPGSFSIFAAMLTVTFDRFSIHKSVVDNFIHVAAKGGKVGD